MDTCVEVAKLVDTTYKNISDEFAPTTRQLVTAGKAYLKAFHGMVGASRQYNEALSRIATLANHSTMDGSRDIGTALNELAEINKEMLLHQNNILKSLEFDFLEPMETTADKDTKLVGREQKRFQHQYKSRREAYMKCVSTLKKTRRKKNTNTDKQLMQMKMMEETKLRMDEFCEDSLREAVIQERILYGTVLERQCALSKQFSIFHIKGSEILQHHIPQWEELADTKEMLPKFCDDNFRQIADHTESDLEYATYAELPSNSISKSSSSLHNIKGHRRERDSVISAPRPLTTYVVEHNSGIYARPIARAKSDYNLPSSASITEEDSAPSRFNRIVEYNGEVSNSTNSHVRALYTYKANGDHQISLEEGDVIAFTGPRNLTGWQFGDNFMTKKSGWFPLSYTEPLTESPNTESNNRQDSPRTRKRDSRILDGTNDPLPESSKYSTLPLHTATVSSVRSKTSIPGTSQPPSDYGMPQRLPARKATPVQPPMISPSHLSPEDSQVVHLRPSRIHASQPNISTSSFSDTRFREGPRLPSMYL